MAIRKFKPEQIVTVVQKIEVQIKREDRSTGVQGSGDPHPDLLPLAEGVGEGEPAPEAAGGGTVAGEARVAGWGPRKLLSPERRHYGGGARPEESGLSKRLTCRLLRPWRGTQRYPPTHRPDEDELTGALSASLGRRQDEVDAGSPIAVNWIPTSPAVLNLQPPPAQALSYSVPPVLLRCIVTRGHAWPRSGRDANDARLNEK